VVSHPEMRTPTHQDHYQRKWDHFTRSDPRLTGLSPNLARTFREDGFQLGEGFELAPVEAEPHPQRDSEAGPDRHGRSPTMMTIAARWSYGDTPPPRTRRTRPREGPGL